MNQEFCIYTVILSSNKYKSNIYFYIRQCNVYCMLTFFFPLAKTRSGVFPCRNNFKCNRCKYTLISISHHEIYISNMLTFRITIGSLAINYIIFKSTSIPPFIFSIVNSFLVSWKLIAQIVFEILLSRQIGTRCILIVVEMKQK